MQASQIPVKVQLPWAASAGAGYIRPIPVPSQTGTTPGAASYTDGFPPLTAVAVSAGGVPPDIKDFNGILNAMSAWVQWENAGGLVQFDATFATAIGGYPKGAFLLAATGLSFWLSTADNNTANPDTSGANWVSVTAIPATATPQIDGTAAVGVSMKFAREDHVHSTDWCGLTTGTAAAQVLTTPAGMAGVADGASFSFKVGAGLTNTGAVTIQLGAFGTFPLLKNGPVGPVALTGGELQAGNVYAAQLGVSATNLYLRAGAMGTAAQANASSGTGIVAAVSGSVAVGNIPIFSDTLGTFVDSGATPASLRGAGDTFAYQLGLSC